jgi:hypothetical protein
MKEYVLDTPAALDAPAAGNGVRADDYVPPIAPSSWPSLMWLLLLEPLALALLYVVLVGFPGRSQASLEAAPVVVAAFSFPKAAEAQAVSEAPAAPESSIVHKHGRYVVDLHGASVASALAMLSKVTGATVAGGEALSASPELLTKVFETSSPVEAWQAVFGGVANFAIACTKGTCAVRFVAPADLAQARPSAALAAAVSPAPQPVPAAQPVPVPGAAEPAETAEN